LTLTLAWARSEEFGVRWPSSCEDVIQGAEERPLLEDVTQQRSEDHDWQH
jgi:hypothetical protein